jgi:hydrogenase maturation protein HypF
MNPHVEPVIRTRIALTVRGTVQGVGFRPHVARCARDHGVSGGVRNTLEGVRIELEGAPSAVAATRAAIIETIPYRDLIHEIDEVCVPPAGSAAFTISPSGEDGARSVWITPDLAMCEHCAVDVADPDCRRYRYPFTTCARCGPRYSILHAIPFDRANTVMREFPLCAACESEYADPDDRRYHAQAFTCPVCGPTLTLYDGAGQPRATGEDALAEAAALIRSHGVLALQGLGGFQLLVDAGDEIAVDILRTRKQRPRKPLAVMFRSVDSAAETCELDGVERALLTSTASPIVLAHRRRDFGRIVEAVAPGNPLLGVMVPYTPLHRLLMDLLDGPIVATSGNVAGEPICIDLPSALGRLGGIADGFLAHDRPILRPVDDSVVRVVGGRPLVLRSARGYAPLTIPFARPDDFDVFAAGGHLKNTVARTARHAAVISQHVGDLDTAPGRRLAGTVRSDLDRLYGGHVRAVARDMHPDYASSRAVETEATDIVQHHHAHVVSAMVEHDLDGTVLGIVWDGTGFGTDGTIWGGEFLIADRASFTRHAHLRTFPLPGGEAAIVDPRRTAFGALWEMFGEAAVAHPAMNRLPHATRRNLARMLARGVHAPRTSAMGRLFDVVAALTRLCEEVTFEGQAAIAVEFAAARGGARGGLPRYPFDVRPAPENPETLVIDWAPCVLTMLNECEESDRVAFRFHETMVAMAVAVARRQPERRIVLTGGCFQNKLLTERLVGALEEIGFLVFTHRRVPPNDGGLAVGQLGVAAMRRGDD